MNLVVMKTALVLVGMAFCLLATGCGIDECDELGEEWCEDGKVMTCVQDGIGEALNNGVKKVRVEYDCGEEDSYCIEEEVSPHDYAYCASMLE